MSQMGQLRAPSGGGGGDINTITGNSGGAVGPDGFNNINIIGAGSISVAGNPGTNTLTINMAGDVAIDFQADDGNIATPAANTLQVDGGDNINTAAPGSADIIEINLNDSILLPATTGANEGVIALGADLTNDRFMHNYAPGGSADNNTFLGRLSGNFTLTGTLNTGLGARTLESLTTGSFNVAVGSSALINATTGGANVVVGQQSGNSITTGGFNTILGAASGTAYTTESSNILIKNVGTIADANAIRIGTQGAGAGQQNKAYMAGIYNTSPGATYQVGLVGSDGKLGSSTGTNGQILIGATAGNPTWANITSADLTVTITNGANTIDLSVNNAPQVYTLTTNNAVATALFTGAVADNSAVTITATVAAAKSDYSASLWGTVSCGSRRSGGGAVLVDIPTIGFGDDSAAVPQITAGVSGNNIIIYATGVAAETWNWKATVITLTQI